MTLVHYQPWNMLNQVQKDLNRVFDSANDTVNADESNVVTSHWTPAVDIKELDDRFVLYADLAGVDPKEIDITMDQGVLTVKGERVDENAEEGEGYRRMERVRGNFHRRFSLPDTADADRIQASGNHGVLEIVIPKHEKVHPRKIAVNA